MIEYCPGQRLDSIKVFLLGMGIAFSVASSLRLEGLPIGVGEVLLLLWCILALCTQKKPHVKDTIYLITFGLIGISLLLMILGYFYGYLYGVKGFSGRSALAYFFSWGLLFVLTQQRGLNIRKILGWTIRGFLLSVIIAMFIGPLYGNHNIDIYWTGETVSGYWENLSDNRNQFALLVLIIPFIASTIFPRKGKSYWRLVSVVLLVLVLAILVRSDALWLGWCVGGAVTVLFALKRRRDANDIAIRDLWLGGVLFVCAILIMGYKFWFINMINEYHEARSMVPKTGIVISDVSDVIQARSRMELLRNGVEAIALSPLVGFGPGSFSGDNGPFEGREAHNTLIDWATQTGVVGGIALLFYWFWVLWYVVKNGETVLIGLIVALGAFACFHYTLRQPLFWVIPALVLLDCVQSDARLTGGE